MSNKSIFENVYERNIWGGLRGTFYSGMGSDEPFSSEYAAIVVDLVRELSIRSIVDLGCGDYRIGSRFADLGLHYTGIDVVPSLIAHNKRLYESETVSFLCMDATTAELPHADLFLIRLVLQHLSNTEIQTILSKVMRSCRYALITEHCLLDKDGYRPNLDQPHSGSIRIFVNSGVHPELWPFNLKKLQLTINHDAPGGLEHHKMITQLFDFSETKHHNSTDKIYPSIFQPQTKVQRTFERK